MRHFNPSISEDKHRILNLKSGEDNSEVLEYLTPTIEIEPNIDIVEHALLENATSQTLYTTPSDKDFFLTSAGLSISKDANATTTGVSLRAYIKGVEKRIINIPLLTLTAGQIAGQTFFFGKKGIKIDRGTIISIASLTNVALIRASSSIQGYTRETLKGV